MLDALAGRFLGAEVGRTEIGPDDAGCSYMSHLRHDVGAALTSPKDCSVVLSYEMVALCSSTLAQNWFSARPHKFINLRCNCALPERIMAASCQLVAWHPHPLFSGQRCSQSLVLCWLRATLAQFLGPSASGILRVEEGGAKVSVFCVCI